MKLYQAAFKAVAARARLVNLYPGHFTAAYVMGRHLTLAENPSFDKQLKELDDNELLDIWEETQRLEHVLSAEWNARFELAPEYERLIVLELRYRMGMRRGTGAG
jgi:hypothetical protein